MLIHRLTNWLRQWRRGACTPDYRVALDRARGWIEANSNPDGVCLSARQRQTYREVTGYFIPTLIKLGEHQRARAWAESLRQSVQSDGSVTHVSGRPYVFDTAQVMRGFLCYASDADFQLSLARCGEYLLRQQLPDGSFPDPYEGKIPTYIFLYCLEPWRTAAAVLARPDFAEAADRALAYYTGHFEPQQFKAHSHFYGYAAEALIDLECHELARQTLEVARCEIRRDGALRAAQGARWVCGPGQAQFAICYYKVGDLETGDRLLHWLMRHQLASGGVRGAYGRGSAYFNDDEPSWAMKFFIDAILLRIRKHFELEFPQWMDRKEREGDARLQAVASVIQGLEAGRVLEIGCGNGRFLSQLRRRYPRLEYHGLDLSEPLVAALPEWMHGRQGDMMALPYPDGHFDVVFMIESLEHAPVWRGAVQEALRVLKPGGCLAIIDKDVRHLGQVKIMPWERWFDVELVLDALRDQVPDANASPLPGASRDALFVLWSGRKHE